MVLNISQFIMVNFYIYYLVPFKHKIYIWTEIFKPSFFNSRTSDCGYHCFNKTQDYGQRAELSLNLQ